ncbi:MAG TPA: hypothetical protein VIG30_18015 [Ktedonobacterales bacterium]|jgi:hypothetical protein
MRLDEDFTGGELGARWTRTQPNGGTLTCAGSVLRLALPDGATAGRYGDAQIDDYGRLPRQRFPWRPPLRLEVRARASHPQHPPTGGGDVAGMEPTLRGTAGFGFWNYPFSLTGTPLALPEAVWFFYASPPSNMALVPGVAGWGWKAQVIHARRWGAVAAGVPALAALGWARATGRERAAGRWLRRVSGAAEAHLAPDLTAWHDYTLDWRRIEARFAVDGREVLVAPRPPPGPLGFVAWIDNQYAVATPRGVLRFGTLDCGPQWLDLDLVRISPL